MDRRQFLKAGLVGGAVLTTAALWYGWRRVDTDEQDAMLGAVAAAILDGMLPVDPTARAQALAETVTGVRRAVAGLSAAAQEEVAQLFALLSARAGRVLLAGLWSDWRETRHEDVAAFLQRWRESRFDLLRASYAALHDLVLGAWYSDARHWPAIGYPGPPRLS
jgi:hypothetical protein